MNQYYFVLFLFEKPQFFFIINRCTRLNSIAIQNASPIITPAFIANLGSFIRAI